MPLVGKGKDPSAVFPADAVFLVLGILFTAVPFFDAFWRWFADHPSLAKVEWTQVWPNLAAYLLLVALLPFVQEFNEKAARAIQKDIERIEAADEGAEDR